VLNMRELTAHMKAIATVVREHVSKAFSDLSTRLERVEISIKELPQITAESLVEQAAKLVLQELPTPKNGENGKDADPQLIKQFVVDAFAEIPVPTNGIDGKSITVDDVAPLLNQLVTEKVSAIPIPKDGESIPVEQVQKMVDEAVAKALQNIPVPKNGEPGRDAVDIEILPAINPEKSYPRGTFATHLGGLFRSYQTTEGLKGWECIVDGIAEVECEKAGDRNFSLKVTRSSGPVAIKDIFSTQMIYRGVFTEGEFMPGDTVTWAGAMWHCDEKTSDKPGEIGSKGWTLCVKKGRDGKDGVNGKDLTKGVSIK